MYMIETTALLYSKSRLNPISKTKIEPTYVQIKISESFQLTCYITSSPKKTTTSQQVK